MIPDMKHPTRRELAAATAFTLVPRHVLGGSGYQAPSDTLNLAGIGVGGVGKSYLKGVDSQNIAALCDVDDEKAAPVYETYPTAKTYRDYRVLLDKEKGIDGVVIGTPDHTHAVIMMAAFKLGKHVYCAKPLTRTIAESRAIRDAAREAKVATQMSVQSCASDASLTTAEWVRSGAIGKVREVHVWNDRPVWPQGLFRPKTGQPVPSSLDWNLWLGPAKQRPYSEAYHPFKFRGWYDFGTGALGDMGCHTFHVIVRSLELGDPATVSATHADVIRPRRPDEEEHWSGSKRVEFPETYPHASIVTWQFPRRGKLPPVSLTWYDGGLKPPCPPDWTPGQPLPADGILFKGSKGTIFSKFTGTPSLLPEHRNASFKPPKPKLQRTVGHYEEWIAACKGGKPANCEFEFATYLTELTLLGNLAVRTRENLTWNPTDARTNSSTANQYLDDPYRTGWSL
jgi:predicted dehydrogenase